ncbi:5-carboxymethyl-2-hydroxymuconate Delta-isomerase [Aestuariibacter halophilus]|uniref:5-carboxymethyl-2-hydroxymuconate Delta-isomerase n=1 Tax=Fluctibacter halophilus TaxID=226011 RepID=A0ABS8G8H9_9ALTE|nr:5-carboxymethyl-2-hydroxymuconate Delta-isomerase [Aestuariibacter halophilus]MCC2616838.1 5-carboxymethyl-2-hydroxymuconate Delta-isomerase [Aestuariibacter halophilus]
MPHCVIEASQSLVDQFGADTLVEAVHQSAADSGLFDPEDIKTRLMPIAHYRCGSGSGRLAFIHCIVRIMPGRSEQQKAMLSNTVLNGLLSLSQQRVSLTVEVLDIDRACYSKRVLTEN